MKAPEDKDMPTASATEGDGFRLFAALLQDLGEAGGTQEKISCLQSYFSSAPEKDRSRTLGLFTGRKLKRMISTRLLATWVAEWEDIPDWLFSECYHQVGDLAETLSLLTGSEGSNVPLGDLSDKIEMLKRLEGATEEEKKEAVRSSWSLMGRQERFVFNKLITGGFRVGVSAQLVIRSLAKLTGEDPAVIAHRISGQWDPAHTSFLQLIRGEGAADDHSKPYPFYLAHPVEGSPASLGLPSEWHAEWKWDGIRGQLISRRGHWFVWSRGEELLTDKFPELESLHGSLPDGIVLDGEILAMRDGKPLPFATLQTRIGRTRLSKRQLTEAPVGFMAFDLLEYAGEDWRNRTFNERRAQLAGIVRDLGHPSLLLSESIPFSDWDGLAGLRAGSRSHGSEGLMLKRGASAYQAGRKRGDWWKWKTDPMTIDAVMVYAQKGHGRRSNLYTDYTFAVRNGAELVVCAKAYSGLTDREIAAVDAFVKKHALEKFGPVRTVRPELVFEIAFEGISESKRHRSGIALRFPRISRWRTDKKPEEIDTLEDLRNLLRQHTAATQGSNEISSESGQEGGDH
jgi:DNA ligase-1